MIGLDTNSLRRPLHGRSHNIYISGSNGVTKGIGQFSSTAVAQFRLFFQCFENHALNLQRNVL